MDVQREETAEETNKMEAMLTTKVCFGLQVIYYCAHTVFNINLNIA